MFTVICILVFLFVKHNNVKYIVNYMTKLYLYLITKLLKTYLNVLNKYLIREINERDIKCLVLNGQRKVTLAQEGEW